MYKASSSASVPSIKMSFAQLSPVVQFQAKGLHLRVSPLNPLTTTSSSSIRMVHSCALWPVPRNAPDVGVGGLQSTNTNLVHQCLRTSVKFVIVSPNQQHSRRLQIFETEPDPTLLGTAQCHRLPHEMVAGARTRLRCERRRLCDVLPTNGRRRTRAVCTHWTKHVRFPG